MSKLQGTTAQQAVPLWDRTKNERGHLSSVDKAVAAHRQRVSERQNGTEHKLSVAQDISDRFFPQPAIPSQAAYQKFANLNAMEVDSYQNYQQDYIDGSMVPVHNQVQGIYEEINMSPVRDHAVAVLNKDSEQVSQNPVEEDVPKGSYIDYTV